MSLKQCREYGRASGELFDGQDNDMSKKISDLNARTRRIFNKLTTAKVASNLENSIESMDQSIEAIKNVFNFPSDLMGGFFRQFLDTNNLPTIG